MMPEGKFVVTSTPLDLVEVGDPATNDIAAAIKDDVWPAYLDIEAGAVSFRALGLKLQPHSAKRLGERLIEAARTALELKP